MLLHFFLICGIERKLRTVKCCFILVLEPVSPCAGCLFIWA